MFAIPGSIHAPLAKGCHKLIREGAKLVQTAQDVLEELGLAPPAAQLQSAEAGPISDNPVLAALADEPADVDTLVARTDLPADAVLVELTELELAGIVASLPGAQWQRRRKA